MARARWTMAAKRRARPPAVPRYHDGWQNNGAGAAIGDGGTTSRGNTGTVKNGENQFSTDKDSIQDGAEVKMTNIGHNSPNTVTQTYKTDKWETEGMWSRPGKVQASEGQLLYL